MSQNETPENVVALEQPVTETATPVDTEAKPDAPKSIAELVQRIDIEGVAAHEVITDLVAGIQQLAMRGTIALGLLERIHMRDMAESANVEEDLKS